MTLIPASHKTISIEIPPCQRDDIWESARGQPPPNYSRNRIQMQKQEKLFPRVKIILLIFVSVFPGNLHYCSYSFSTVRSYFTHYQEFHTNFRQKAPRSACKQEKFQPTFDSADTWSTEWSSISRKKVAKMHNHRSLGVSFPKAPMMVVNCTALSPTTISHRTVR
jgi:hypothetical protein